MPPEDGFGGLRQLGMNPLPPELEVRRVSEIEARPVWWLWQGRIARGKVTMLAGHPGLGKSQVGLDFAARLTRGGRWPDGTYAEAGSVVILSAEDDAEDTIRPRLEAAAADLTRCHVVGAVREPGKGPRTFCLQEDLVRLAAVLDDIGDVALIIVDPITAYLGEIDLHKNAEVRALLALLAEFAARYGAAVLAISHLRKSLEGDAILRVSGSLAFVAAARAVYLVASDPGDRSRRLLLPAKNNLGTDNTGYAYRVVPYSLKSGRIATCCVEWEPEAVTMTADEAFTASKERRAGRKLDSAMDFLREFLNDGPRPQKEVQAAAREAGHAWMTVKRAAADLEVGKTKDGFGGPSVWSLTGGVSQETKLDAAMEWLGEQLADGPRAQIELQVAARAAGHAWATVRRAATELEIVASADGDGGERVWSLAGGVVPPAEETEL